MIKKACYWLDIFHSVKLPVPVIVVDSVSIDNDSKTPLLLWLVDCLLADGFSPAIITRGNPDNPGLPAPVTLNADRQRYGTKTLLIAEHIGMSCPIWSGNDRIAVAEALLNAYPACNVILYADGLQDCRLERDIEVIVVDFNEQSFGNGLLLPAGPLRASLDDLNKESFIVTNNDPGYLRNFANRRKTYVMKLFYEIAYKILDSKTRKTVSDFGNEPLHAVSDVNNFHWFHEALLKARIDAEFHAYSENHRFIPQDIDFPNADAVLMPEENALQCQDFANDKLWALPQKAWIDSELQSALLNKLRNISNQSH